MMRNELLQYNYEKKNYQKLQLLDQTILKKKKKKKKMAKIAGWAVLHTNVRIIMKLAGCPRCARAPLDE